MARHYTQNAGALQRSIFLNQKDKGHNLLFSWGKTELNGTIYLICYEKVLLKRTTQSEAQEAAQSNSPSIILGSRRGNSKTWLVTQLQISCQQRHTTIENEQKAKPDYLFPEGHILQTGIFQVQSGDRFHSALQTYKSRNDLAIAKHSRSFSRAYQVRKGVTKQPWASKLFLGHP